MKIPLISYALPESGIRSSAMSHPCEGGTRWVVEFSADTACGDSDLVMEIGGEAGPETMFWLPWADPRPNHQLNTDPSVRMADGVVRGDLVDWADPLLPRPWRAAQFSYGAPPYDFAKPHLGYWPFFGAVTALPMLTRIEGTRAVSFFLHPEDAKLDLVIETTESGAVLFRHRHYRVGGEVCPSFRLEIVEHEPDIRAALGEAVRRWPDYFQLENPSAARIAGTGAYSSHMGAMDLEALREMAFGVNWKASYDFPYMGMFLPPVDDGDEWTSFGGWTISVRQLRAYAKEMRGHGFHVLSYFNLHEFGAGVSLPFERRKELPEWLDQNVWLRDRFPEALLHPPREEVPDWPDVLPQPDCDGQQPLYWSWSGCVAMDPGDPDYAEFLLDQAARHIEQLPDADGICIDRLDWVRLYNFQADDGISWLGGRPARSLHSSQRMIMARLAALLHPAGKVMFINNHVKRLEHMLHADGIFDEFTYGGCSLNTSGFLCLNKPALGWTSDEKQLRYDPDGYYQRHLHMGVYPMAPFPGNDHSLRPSEFADRLARDYGPIFRLLEGKQWILAPNLVEIDDPSAHWNAFKTSCGILIPVTGATLSEVKLRVRLADISGSPVVYHPGEHSPYPLLAESDGDEIVLKVPILRKCAAVFFRGEDPVAVNTV